MLVHNNFLCVCFPLILATERRSDYQTRERYSHISGLEQSRIRLTILFGS